MVHRPSVDGPARFLCALVMPLVMGLMVWFVPAASGLSDELAPRL